LEEEKYTQQSKSRHSFHQRIGQADIVRKRRLRKEKGRGEQRRR
jgi:hypothetical protein